MKTCLVVDDSSVIRKVARRILEGLDFEITEAEDGKQAMDRVASKMPDAILLDWNMPNMDGYETAEKIRSNPKFLNLAVIAVTAKAMTGDREKCIRAGASDYITKPVDVDQLLSLLRVWLYDKI